MTQNTDTSLVSLTFPEENPQTYFWRGDLGLLDRLSYGDSRQIPQNWNMTSLDAARIEERNRSSLLALPPTTMNLIDNHGDENRQDMSKPAVAIREPQCSSHSRWHIGPTSQSETVTDFK